jgi:hypothetical protein
MVGNRPFGVRNPVVPLLISSFLRAENSNQLFSKSCPEFHGEMRYGATHFGKLHPRVSPVLAAGGGDPISS